VDLGAMSSLLIRAAEVAGAAHRDLRVREGRIVELDTRLHRLPGETLIDAEIRHRGRL